LFNTICDALDQHQGKEVPAPAAARKTGPPRRVLLVEDGVVNQRVARGFLERAGHQVVVAANGREGVQALANHPFDVILMDVQMPVMDGLEATAAIREREAETGGHIPIVAMTAAAMKGDRERCLAGGMDAYVSKPIDPAELFATMNSLLEGSGNGHERPGDSSPPDPSVDLQRVLDRVPGGVEGVRSLARLFLEECRRLTGEIRQGVVQDDPKAVRRAAHTLKSSAQIFAAEPLAAAARTVEQLGRAGQLREVEPHLPGLEQAAHQACEAIQNWLQQQEDAGHKV
jgi:two-component system, sensor histidine kinase and response regulator